LHFAQGYEPIGGYLRNPRASLSGDTYRSAIRWLITTFTLLVTPHAHALDPSRWISQYGHRSWTLPEGAFPGAPTVMTQTTDGYLWIGTRAGLLRFDGVRFTPIALPPGEQIRSLRILSLKAATDGSLWIGTRSDLERWRNGHLTHYPDALGSINAIREHPRGHIWFLRARINEGDGALCEVLESIARCHGPADGVPFTRSRDLEVDAQGGFWMTSDTTLVHWKSGLQETYVPAGITADNTVDVFDSMAIAPDGSLWIGAAQPSRGLGLLRFAAGQWLPVVMPGFDGRTIAVSALLRDRENALWVGTQSDGLYRLYDGKVAHYRARDGLSSDTIQNMFEDREGNLWVMTPNGVDAFRDVRVANVSTHEGLDSDLVNGVLATRDGTIWINTWHSLARLHEGKITLLNSANGLPGEEVTATFEDRAGRLWIGIDGGLVVYEHGKFTPVTRRNGMPVGLVDGIAEDPSGDMWVTSIWHDGWLLRFHDFKSVAEVPRSDVPFAYAHTIVADPSDGIWIALKNGDLGHYHQGTLETVQFHRAPATGLIWGLLVLPDGSIVGGTSAGLIGWRDGKSLTMTRRNGLPCEEIHSLLMDRHGALWMYATCGLFSVRSDELQKWLHDPAAIVQVRAFDAFDGVQPALPAFFPRSSAAPDGTLWFANGSVAQVIDPDRIARNTLVPPVRIEQVIADRHTYPLQEHLHLPARNRDLEIDYTALSFVIPRKVQFRYRLDGHDREWREAGTRRQAFYTDLPPGQYRFRVIASNNDGVWNETGASLNFSIQPTFYQTWWFALLCVAIAAGLVWLLVLWRVQQIQTRMRGRLEERLVERERIARELHDTFLQSVQGLVLQFQSAMEKIPQTEPARRAMENALDRADDVLAEGRDRVADLRASAEPRDDLPQALQFVGEQHAALHGVLFRLAVEGASRRLHPVAREEVELICKEALANAFRHSGAQHVDLDLSYSDAGLTARIVDDGHGFDAAALDSSPTRRHFGLVGMRERARKIHARLEVSSRRTAGTSVELRVPASVAFPPSRGRQPLLE
jgi:signal transduction histidine kinase/ligand-binding sensor domain-containing protein